MEKIVLKNEIYVNGFTASLRELLNERLPVAKSFMLTRLAKQVDSQREVFDNTRAKLIEQYGTKQKDGNYKFTKENEKKVNEEFAELLKIGTEYEYTKVALDESVNIKPKDLLILEEILDMSKVV